MTNQEHNKYIAWVFLVNGSFQLLMLLFVFVILTAMFAFGDPANGDFPASLMAMIFGVVGFINLIFLSPNFIAAYALLKRKPWARVASIIAAVMSAMNVPIGTAACVYSLWFFFGDQWKMLYPQDSAENVEQRQIQYGVESKWDGHQLSENGEIVYRHQDPPDWR